MAITPGAGPLELTGPQTTFASASFRLFAAVVISRNGKARRDHPGTQVAAAGAADGQNAAEAVMAIRPTIERFSGDERDQKVACLSAAGPIAPLGIGAGLVQFGSIDAEQANTLGS